jgi:hypothetical protein
VKELAQFLHMGSHTVRKAAKVYGFLKRIGMGGSHPSRDYVSEYAAMRLIAHFRILQGQEYENGYDFHRLREQRVEHWRRQKAALRATSVNER